MNNNRSKQLDKADAGQKKALYGAVLYYYLTKAPSSIPAIVALNKEIAGSIKDVQDQASEIALDHAEEDTDEDFELPEDTRKNDVLLYTTASTITAAITYYALEKPISEAIADARSKIELISTNIFFQKYTEDYVDHIQSTNLSGYFVWNAQLDKRTCSKCSGLSGQKFPKNNPPDCPAHSRCRCFVFFEQAPI